MAGGHLFLLGEKKKAEALIERALELEPDNVGTHYNLACMYAKSAEPDRAIESLTRAIRIGFNHKEWIEHDADLESLRDDPRFKELLSKLK